MINALLILLAIATPVNAIVSVAIHSGSACAVFVDPKCLHCRALTQCPNRADPNGQRTQEELKLIQKWMRP